MLFVLAVGVRPRAVGQPRDAEFQALLTAAETAVSHRRWDEARTTYEALRDRARGAYDELWDARATAGLGVVAFRESRYREARGLLLEALAVFERAQATADIANVNRWLGSVAEFMGDRREADARYRRAFETFDIVGDIRGRAHVALSLLVLNETSDAADTTSRLQSLQQDAERLGDQELLGLILHYWGNWLVKRAQYEAARDKLEAARACYRAAGNREHMATTFMSLGELYRQHGQLPAALHAYLQALEILQTLDSPQSVMVGLNSVALAYVGMGDERQARDYYERAITLGEEIGATRLLQSVRGYFGAMLTETGDVSRGRAMLEQVVDHAGGLRGLRYAQLSNAYRLEGRPQEALHAAQQALDACRTEVVRMNCLHAQLAHARAEVALGDETTALEDQREVLAAIEDIHTTLAASDFLKQGYQALWQPAYSLAIELQVRRQDWRRALDTAELARARAFLDLLASRDLQERGHQPPSPLESLTLRGNAAGTSLRSEASAPAPTTSHLAAIAERLRSTLVLYWIGEDHIYAWVISPDGALHGATVDLARWKLDRLIRSTTAFANGADGRAVRGPTILTRGAMPIVVSRRKNPAWRALYDLLIKPIEHDLPHTLGARLTVVPAGPLLTLPFGALRDSKGRYLIERYALHTVPAAGILRFTAARRHAEARAGEVLMVADPAPLPTIPGEPPLSRLPGALAEAHAIARLIPAGRTRLLSAADATEAHVHDMAAHRAVIHFATHAIVHDADPLASFLALSVSGHGDADGQLTAQKIYSLGLDADLVVLSACRSAGGMMTGDGLASLARAFFYAGTPSLVASLWDVADEPTNRLLPEFYRAWLRGADKALALRRAQLNLIRELRAGRVIISTSAGELTLPEDPAFWAGFVLLGEPD